MGQDEARRKRGMPSLMAWPVLPSSVRARSAYRVSIADCRQQTADCSASGTLYEQRGTGVGARLVRPLARWTDFNIDGGLAFRTRNRPASNKHSARNQTGARTTVQARTPGAMSE
ncbi:hypothetical protein EDB81DRAFT_862372, partial [Dactylonectria macrodidyma]